MKKESVSICSIIPYTPNGKPIIFEGVGPVVCNQIVVAGVIPCISSVDCSGCPEVRSFMQGAELLVEPPAVACRKCSKHAKVVCAGIGIVPVGSAGFPDQAGNIIVRGKNKIHPRRIHAEEKFKCFPFTVCRHMPSPATYISIDGDGIAGKGKD